MVVETWVVLYKGIRYCELVTGDEGVMERFHEELGAVHKTAQNIQLVLEVTLLVRGNQLDLHLLIVASIVAALV
jgi:hypothetical protein